MNHTATTKFDASKLNTRDRLAYENGMALVSKKLAAARLAEIARKAVPRSFRITPSAASSKEFEAVRPRTVRGKTRTTVVFQTLAD